MIDAHPAKDPSSPWIYGTLLKDRRSGWFPSSYVVEISTSQSISRLIHFRYSVC